MGEVIKPDHNAWIYKGFGTYEHSRLEFSASSKNAKIKTVSINALQSLGNALFGKERFFTPKEEREIPVQKEQLEQLEKGDIPQFFSEVQEMGFDTAKSRLEKKINVIKGNVLYSSRAAGPREALQTFNEEAHAFIQKFRKESSDPTRFLWGYHAETEKIRSLTTLAKVVLRESEKSGGSIGSEFQYNMKTIFEEIIPQLPSSPFSKEDFKMPHVVEEFLSPKLKELRAKKQKAGPTDDDMQRLERKVAKGNLAVKLGHGFKDAKGTTGTLMITDINGKIIGVHKVDDKDVRFSVKVKNWFKAMGWGQLSHLSRGRFAQPRAERAADIISTLLHLNLTARSSETSIGNKRGVFQIFISKEKEPSVPRQVHSAGSVMKERRYQEAKKVLTAFNKKSEDFTTAERGLFQRFAIFDYIIGNLDRHEENWLVITNDKGKVTHIKAIDNANSFPMSHPKKGSSAARNQYKWKELNIAKEHFTVQSQRLVDGLNAEEMLEKLEEMPIFLNKEMRDCFKLRIAALKALVKVGQTPQLLAEHADDESMRAAVAQGVA